MRSAITAAALVALSVAPAAAPADSGAAERPRDDLVSWLGGELQRRIDDATRPAPVPPVPVKVVWRSRRLAAVDLGAPLLAIAAADVDGDGAAELVALTTREALVLELSGKRKVSIAARVELPGAAPEKRPRDAVGALVVDDTDGDGVPEIMARASEQAKGARWVWRDGKLAPLGELSGYPLCAGVTAELAPGRNYFTGDSFEWSRGGEAPEAAPEFYAARCRADLVDAEGMPVALFGLVDSGGTLVVTRVDARAARIEVRKRGVAFDIADVDNDGSAEIITTTNRAPGRGDQVHVYAIQGGTLERIAKSKRFTGGVAGIATGDIDGDGDRDVVAAIRLVGSSKVDLWTLNR